jgi:hypothetical protein
MQVLYVGDKNWQVGVALTVYLLLLITTIFLLVYG